MEELLEKISDLQKRLGLLIKKLKIEERKTEIKALEEEVAKPGFWGEPKEAQRKTRLLALYKTQQDEVENFSQRLSREP